jgi:hypothetical protein
MDLDYVVGPPLAGLDTPLQQVASVRLFGVTSTGTTRCDADGKGNCNVFPSPL